MSKLIDTNVLLQKISNGGPTSAVECVGIIMECPEVDATQIVRCKNCEHWCNDIPARDIPEGYGICGKISEAMYDEDEVYETPDWWYCASGKPRDDEESD